MPTSLARLSPMARTYQTFFGRLWVAPNKPEGVIFQFMLLAKAR
jgi:hypothetical protein